MKQLFVVLIALFSINSAQAIHIVSKEAHIDITTDKIIRIEGELDPTNGIKWATQGQATQMLPGDRVILINSTGGRVDIGSIMIDGMLREAQGGHIRLICVVEHEADSMAFNLLSFCDVRLAVPRAHMLVHHISYMSLLPQQLGKRLTAKNLRELATEIEVADIDFSEQNRKLMGLTKEDYELFADHEHIWTAETLLEHHYLNGLAVISK